MELHVPGKKRTKYKLIIIIEVRMERILQREYVVRSINRALDAVINNRTMSMISLLSAADNKGLKRVPDTAISRVYIGA